MKVHDLDKLKPEPIMVKLGGKEIDISFVPSGVALEMMRIREKLEALTGSSDKLKKIEEGGGEAQQSFLLAAEICALLTKAQYEEMDREWLLNNTNVQQLKVLIELITNSVFESLGDDSKNQ